MKVEQVYQLVNTITTEITGQTDLVQEDLSNVVDIGTEIFNATSVDNYVRSLVNHIGKVIFVNRAYSGGTPSVLMDGWEYGSVLEKIQADMPSAVENETWELVDGQSYDPNVFHKPTVSAKFFNDRVTFEIDVSFTDRQVKESFSSAAQLNGFLSMLYNEVDKSLTVKMDALIMRTINNMIAETAHDGSPSRYINLLALYNAARGTNLLAANALTDPEFIRYASYYIGLYVDRLSRISTLFNIGGKARFTPKDKLHIVMLSDFQAAALAYLQSDTYHDMYTALPNAETVPYWQGSGTNYDFASISKVDVIPSMTKEATVVNGVLGIMFDRDALGVANLDRRVTAHYNPKAEFTNNFYKFEAGYFNDLNENFVVFYIGDPVTP